MFKKRWGWLFLIVMFVSNALASETTFTGKTSAPQPTTCIVGQFSAPNSSEQWSEVNLKLTNQCEQSVDLQNSVVQFKNTANLNTSIWGEFSAISYPSPAPVAVSAAGTDNYLVSINLTFPEGDQYWKPETNLAPGKSITLSYGVDKPGYVENSAQVFLNQSPIETGTIKFVNKTAQPNGVSTNPIIDIYSGQNAIKQVSVAWNSNVALAIAPGKYTIKPETFKSGDSTYSGTAQPADIVVEANKTITTNIIYEEFAANGLINIKMPTLPTELAGYTDDVQVTLTDGNGSGSAKTVKWNQSNTINNLIPTMPYTFNAPVISNNGYNCSATFNPTELAAGTDASHIPLTSAQYQCVEIKQDVVNINVSGVDNDTSSVKVKFTPNDNSQSIEKQIALNAGSGSDTTKLNDGMMFNVASSDVNGYSVSIQPQSFVAHDNVNVAVSYQKMLPISQVVGPYVDTTSWPFYHFEKTVAETGNKFARLGFIVADRTNACHATWGTYYEMGGFADLDAAIPAMRTQGGDVIASFGGQANLPLDAACTTVDSLKKEIARVIDIYQLKYIDFDIEGADAASVANMDRLAQAIVSLQKDPLYKDVKISYTLAVLPEGLTDGLNSLNSAAKFGANITHVNLMTMDYGYPASNMGELAIKAATSTVNQLKKIYPNKSEAELWAMIGITPMIGNNDTQGETFTLNDACLVKKFADQNKIGALSMWSANRDSSAGSGIQQTTNEFQKIFTGKEAC